MSDDLRELASHLHTDRLGQVHEHHDVLDSTNDRALAWLTAPEAPPDGAVVTADTQRRGRGRLGRAWSSPPGEDLYVSVITRPGEVRHGIGALGLAVGVGLREGTLAAVRSINDGACPFDVSLKWPNDLRIGERKIAGILCEARWQGRRADVVVGFGLNVRRADFDPALESIATSLHLALAGAGMRTPPRTVLLAALLEHLEVALDDFYRGGFAAIRSRYEPHSVVLGRSVSIGTPDDAADPQLRGVAEGLAADGALLLRVPGRSELVRVEHGDVWLG